LATSFVLPFAEAAAPAAAAGFEAGASSSNSDASAGLAFSAAARAVASAAALMMFRSTIPESELPASTGRLDGDGSGDDAADDLGAPEIDGDDWARTEPGGLDGWEARPGSGVETDEPGTGVRTDWLARSAISRRL